MEDDQKLRTINLAYRGGSQIKARCEYTGAEIKVDFTTKDCPSAVEAFLPHELFGVGLGSCMVTLMAIFGSRMSLKLSNAQMVLIMELDKAKELINKFIMEFSSSLQAQEGMLKQIEQAGEGCPMHNSLNPNIILEHTFKWGNTQR